MGLFDGKGQGHGSQTRMIANQTRGLAEITKFGIRRKTFETGAASRTRNCPH